MIQAARIIATGLASTGLIAVGVSTGSTLIAYVIGTSVVIALLMIISLIRMPTGLKPGMGIPIAEKPGMPGVRCPICASRGVVTWVLPGKHCPKCGHACDW